MTPAELLAALADAAERFDPEAAAFLPVFLAWAMATGEMQAS